MPYMTSRVGKHMTPCNVAQRKFNETYMKEHLQYNTILLQSNGSRGIHTVKKKWPNFAFGQTHVAHQLQKR